MEPTTATTGQPMPILRSGGDGTVMYGVLASAILALATVVVVLWRRDVRRADRALKLAEERAEAERTAAEAKAEAERVRMEALTAREIARTEAVAARLATERGEFVKALESQRDQLLQVFTAQRETDRALLDRQRAEFEATIRGVVERQATSDVARDGKLMELVTQVGRVVEALAPHHAARRKP